MELRVELSEHHRNEASQLILMGRLREVNGILLAIGVHIDFRFDHKPSNDTRPSEIIIYAEEK